jgi:hypothetical protein
MNDIATVRDGRLRYKLHPGQTRAWRSEARFILILAGFQGGKTTFLPVWLKREMERRGPGDYIAASSTFPLFQKKFLPELRKFFCSLTGWGTYNASQSVIESHAGASEADKYRIWLYSAHNPESLESATGKAAILDEWGQDSVAIEAWDAVTRRLAVNQGRILLGTTPYNLGWLKQQVYDKWVGGDPHYDVVQFRSCDNPSFPDEEYERLRDMWPSWKFEMFCNGKFTRPAGLIYGDYDEAIHCVKPFSIPDTWLRNVGVDFGGTEHTALIWLAEKPGTGEHYVYREALGGGLSGAEHVRAAMEYKEPVKRFLGGAKSEDDQRLTWRIAGCPVVEPFISEVEAGIDRVIGLFKMNRLFVFETCTGLRSELGTYSRELDAAGEPLERIDDKEKFHRLDALRYVCSAFPLDRPKKPAEPKPGPAPRTEEAVRKANEIYTGGRSKFGRDEYH